MVHSKCLGVVVRGGAWVKKVCHFKYSGSVACEKGRIRTKSVRNNWREMSGVVHDKGMPVALAMKMYIMAAGHLAG